MNRPIATPSLATIPRDLASGLVVYFVALPLCLGVALASNAPLLSGVVAGIIGGVIVGLLSQSRVGISGPAAGLTAVVAAQIAALNSFPAFLLALVGAGVIQIGLGIVRAGSLAEFFPTSVIKGLLTAIGVLLILKQIPHVLGHDPDPEGDMAFLQPDSANTFSELIEAATHIQPGAAVIGLTSIAVLVLWNRSPRLRASAMPGPLVVVLLGVALSLTFEILGGSWRVGASHRVQMPVAASLSEYLRALPRPDFAEWSNRAVAIAAIAIAAVASLETLINLEAIEKLDPRRRTASPSRELLAQGVGNVISGLVGGLPVTLAIARSSLNIDSGAQSRISTMFQGFLLLLSVVLLSPWLNLIPLSCLAAILLVTGCKLARPSTVRQFWNQGRYQFIPFAVTVVAIIFTDLLVGILIGLAVSVSFILRSNVKRPIRRIVEKHLGGEVVHVELANQVSFLNRAALSRAFDEVPRGGHLLLDAQSTDYIDPDILEMIRDYKEHTAPARGVELSLVGFRDRYQLRDQTHYVDFASREVQASLTPAQVLDILKEGHERFRTGNRLRRDLGRQVQATATGQHPMAVVLSCIDSRTPAELIFDLGVGDIFSVRVAGNIVSHKAMGSVEYSCAVAGAKLIVVMGHTRCGAVTAAVSLLNETRSVAEITGCQHLGTIVHEIQNAIVPGSTDGLAELEPAQKEILVNEVARRNVQRTVDQMISRSQTLEKLVNDGKIAIVGAMYDVVTGAIDFLNVPEMSTVEA